MSNLLVNAQQREIEGKKVQTLREQGKIPAVLYGHGLKNISLMVNYHEFEVALKEAGESTLVDLKIGDGQPIKVLIHDVQYDAVKHTLIHVDFYQVKMDEEITAVIHLVLVNEAPAIKELGGTLVKGLEEIHVKCLPADLVKEIKVDVSVLKAFEDMIRVKDLPIPKGMEVLADPDTVVAAAKEPMAEEPAPAAEVAPAEGEVPVAAEGEKADAKAKTKSEV
ncbi:MAG: 50S ribosomal protein L25 [Patescibacteria group bacterium]